MRRPRILLAVVLLCLVASLFAWFLSPGTPNVAPYDENTAPLISNVEELERFLSSKQTVLHIDVGWFAQATLSRPLVRQLREEMEHDARYAGIDFRQIDISEQEECHLWIPMVDWLEPSGLSQRPLSSGYGAVLWIKDGKLSTWVEYPVNDGIETLRLKSREVFLSP